MCRAAIRASEPCSGTHQRLSAETLIFFSFLTGRTFCLIRTTPFLIALYDHLRFQYDKQITMKCAGAMRSHEVDFVEFIGCATSFNGAQAAPSSYVPISNLLQALCLWIRAGGCRWRHISPRQEILSCTFIHRSDQSDFLIDSGLVKFKPWLNMARPLDEHFRPGRFRRSRKPLFHQNGWSEDLAEPHQASVEPFGPPTHALRNAIDLQALRLILNGGD